VALTAPADNSSGTTGTPITLSAGAADSDGTIAAVQFFDGATAIGSADAAPPYSVSWTPSSAGVHTLTARATDNGGAVTTSAPVSVSITDSATDTQPPVVAIAAPAALADGLTGIVALEANATDNVAVASVEFQVDGVMLSSDSSAPYGTSFDSGAYAPGQHVLRVRATDAAGNTSAWSSTLVRITNSRVAPAGFTRNVSWVTGLNRAATFTQLPDGRLLVAEQTGALRVVGSDGTLVPTPMLTVSVDSTEERGLVGVVTHPAFSANGFIYIYYTTPEGGTHNRISRFTVSGNTASNEVVLHNLPPVTAGIHNSGAMHFGPDGKLYVAVGDDTIGALAQDVSSPFGKILRFNDDGTIADDNPFCTTQGNLACAVWALGLRNPFTFAIQPGTGRMHINDVGQASWEEINVGARAANFGWPNTEGSTTVAGITAPLLTYPHDPPAIPGTGPGGFFVGICTIGGGFYPASGPFPAPWRGGYFFADFGERFIGFIDLDNDGAAYAFGSVTANPVSVMVAADGALLVLTQGAITRFTAP
jgi:glucose/arabinose dehydrogenase